jgi:hypothetical protein
MEEQPARVGADVDAAWASGVSASVLVEGQSPPPFWIAANIAILVAVNAAMGSFGTTRSLSPRPRSIVVTGPRPHGKHRNTEGNGQPVVRIAPGPRARRAPHESCCA